MHYLSQRPDTNKTRGTQVMEGLLLTQYQNSENLKEYYGAFFKEMDFLFEQIEEVYFGRYIEEAVGEQLDKIGRILNQSRSVPLQEVYFGFRDANGGIVDGFADESSPTLGGLFLSEEQDGYTVVPLDDTRYRRVLMTLGIVLNQDASHINLLYYLVSSLLGKAPAYLRIIETAPQELTLNVEATDVTPTEQGLLYYFITKYLVPTGTSILINRVNTMNKPAFNGADNYIVKDTGTDSIDVETAGDEVSWVSFKTRGLTVGTTESTIIGNSSAALTDHISISQDGTDLRVRVGWDGAGTRLEWFTPLADLVSDGVDFAHTLSWKIHLGNTHTGLEINGKTYHYGTSLHAPSTLNFDTIGFWAAFPSSTLNGSLWGIRHTGLNKSNDVTDLTFLDLNEGVGNVVTSDGASTDTWTIQNTADWQTIL